MLRKKISLLLAVLLVCMLGMTACKKDVGTPEDNATAEEDTDENADQEKYLIGFSVIDMRYYAKVPYVVLGRYRHYIPQTYHARNTL